jgi:uncharacterized SAM-dependent methyltransferase
MSDFKKIELITKEDLDAKFITCLKQRWMPDYFLYLGKTGVKNWLDLEKSPEFTIASGLTGLLCSNVQKLVDFLPPLIDIVSIGVGDGSKEKLILEEVIKQRKARYFPVDISSPMVDEAFKKAANVGIEITGIVAFFEDLTHIKKYWKSPIILCMLGNNICNYHPDDLLSLICKELEKGDYFLFDCHLFSSQQDRGAHWRKTFSKAYHSELNIQFNLGPLIERGIDREDCSFKLDLINVKTPFGETYRTEKFIEILKNSKIAVGDSEITLHAGDVINMGFTYKYTAAQIEEHLQYYNFIVIKKFFDDNKENLLILSQKC